MSERFKPDFIGVGMAKCGSTWVTQILQEHPDIFIPEKKELNFFNETYFGVYREMAVNFNRGLDWYKKQFSELKDESLVGEFSVTYFTDDKAPQRIKEQFPDTKIIITLRNPVDMLQSYYWMFKRTSTQNYESENFAEAIDRDLKQDLAVEIGMYFKFLQKYFDVFGKENVFVVIFEDIKDKPKQVCKNLFDFLGADSEFIPEKANKRINLPVKTRSEGLQKMAGVFLQLLEKLKLKSLYVFLLNNKLANSTYRKLNYQRYEYPKVDDKRRKKLLKYFETDIKKLSNLVNRDLSSLWSK